MNEISVFIKSPLIILTLLFIACNNQRSPENEVISEEEKEIARNLIQGAFDDLWAGLDSTKISKYHTDEFVILENGEIWDNNRIKKFMRKQLSDENRAKRKNIMDYISLDKYGSSIQIAYHNKAEFYNQDSLVGTGSWLESALAIKTQDGWRLKMMHSTWNGNK